MPWVPSENTEDWGRLRVLFNGVDVTYYRDVVTQVRSFDFEEPFSDKTAEIYFPQISPFEALPSWMADWATVEIRVVYPDDSQATLWEGLYASQGDTITEAEGGTVAQCIGAMYQADLLLKPPTINDGTRSTEAATVPGTRDIGKLIRDALADEPSLQLLPLAAPSGSPSQTGIVSSERGSFNGLLTGYIQDLLATAFSTPILADGETAYDIEVSPDGSGYWILGSLGSVIPFGTLTAYHGSMLGVNLNEAASGMTPRPDSEGYWYSGRDGGVFTFNSTYYGNILGNPFDIVEIEANPAGTGYWMVDDIGGVFAFGAATYYGSLPGDAITPVEPVVDFVPTETGLGYWILSRDGGVYAYGDANYHGNTTAVADREWVAIERSKDGDGYWILNTLGEIHAFGDAVYHGNTPDPLNRPAADMARTVDGDGYYIIAEDGGVFALGDADYLGNGFDGAGEVHQWTVIMQPHRQPILKTKDRRHVQWTLACGAPGISGDLSRDLSMAPNAIYGEGITPDYCKWRNTKYPNATGVAAPVFGGVTLSVGSTDADVLIWQREMNHRGWTTDETGTFTENNASVARRLQASAGLTESGKVDAATWAATFQVGGESNDLEAAYIAPLATTAEVEPYIYNANGSVAGNNPAYVPGSVRVERYENFGDGIEKVTAQRWVQSELIKDAEPPYVGSLTLRTDPVEGSRFEIRPGDNLFFKYHRGVTRRFHVTAVALDMQSLTATVTVDERGRDHVSVKSILEREKSSVDPARRRTYRNRASKQVVDTKAVWDCESGAGIIPFHAITANNWNVIRMAAGEYGKVVGTEIETAVPAEIACGVFDRPISVGTLSAAGAPEDPEYWDIFEEDSGLIVAWGGANQMGGYYPGSESEASPLTGKLVDNGTWYFTSTEPPWLWVALWSGTTTSIFGRFRSDPESD